MPLSYTLHDSPGSKHRIALMHSLGLDRAIWDEVAEQLRETASILTFDFRGHGKNERRVTEKFTPELFARDLAELLDHVKWDSAIIGGCSMGGNVAQAFGHLYPSRARGLALIDTTAYYGDDAPAVWRQRIDNARANGLASMVPFQLTRWFGDAFREGHPEVMARWTEVLLANDIDCYAAACEMLGSLDLRSWLGSLKMPVAIVVGEEDYATPVAASEYLHAAIPGSTLAILKGRRHLTPIECPSEVAAQLRDLAAR